MPQVQTYDVRISSGQGIISLANVKSYELLDLKAGIYHKLTLEDDSLLYVNDFGVRTIQVARSGELKVPATY